MLTVLNVSVHPSIPQSIHPSISLPCSYLTIRPSICPYIHLHSSVHASIHSSTHSSTIHPSVHLFICSFVHPSIPPSVHFSIHPSPPFLPSPLFPVLSPFFFHVRIYTREPNNAALYDIRNLSPPSFPSSAWHDCGLSGVGPTTQQ